MKDNFACGNRPRQKEKVIHSFCVTTELEFCFRFHINRQKRDHYICLYLLPVNIKSLVILLTF